MATSYKTLKPCGTIFTLGQKEAFSSLLSTSCCGKFRLRKSGNSVRLFSKCSDSNVVRSCYPDIKLPEMPFHEYVFENSGQWEERTVLECGATGKRWKFKDLIKKSRNLAVALQKKFNLKKGDTQAVVLPNGPEYPAIILAGSMTGVVTTTINPIYTITEISAQLSIAQPKILYTVPELFGKCSDALVILKLRIPIVVIKYYPETEVPSGGVSFSELSESSTPGELSPVTFDLYDDLVIPFSSGTSGLPKGVQLSHKNITANMAQFDSANFLKANPNKETNQSVILGVLPMFHIYGMVVVTFDSLRCGARLVTLPKFEPKMFVETIHTKKTEILYLAPPLILFLANHPVVEPRHLEHVQHVVNGAAPCGSSDIEKLLKKSSAIDISQGYGLTETSPVIVISHKDRFHKLASVGHPLPLTLVKITDVETGKTLPSGEHGEIRVKGPQVMKGYYKKPEETKKTFDEEGWFKTGDVGYYDEENDFYVIDRLKELIKVKGFQVAPAELEEILRSHPKVADAGVVGVPHPELGEAPKAFVVLKEGVSMKEREVEDFIKEKLSPYKQLKGGVRFIEAIPKSSAGKILRKELKTLKDS